jgi:hypothetical protein
MGPFATAIATGCLDALRWLLWLVAALLLALVVVQYARGDEGASPLQMIALAAVAVVAGVTCGLVSTRIAASN